ncbi:hypothetical protein HPB48_018935 [Haemaphysalis longicornis]|uniref:Uncharacterized protein n=1 Tax=Haemaphysalis longicornis TaxID=44386 RepID=A0A9J6FQV5_HAELO|nr:hypothetical protein HPB48_018935 [Haemaphysalis longicornis]
MALQMEPITKDRGVLKRITFFLVRIFADVTSDFKRRVILFAENLNNCAAQREVEEARIVGLSFAVATMRKGERAWVLVSPPYGSDQSKQHPTRCGFADKTVLYKVELLQIIDPQDKLKLHTFVNDGALRRMPYRDVLKASGPAAPSASWRRGVYFSAYKLHQ